MFPIRLLTLDALQVGFNGLNAHPVPPTVTGKTRPSGQFQGSLPWYGEYGIGFKAQIPGHFHEFSVTAEYNFVTVIPSQHLGDFYTPGYMRQKVRIAHHQDFF